MISFLFPFEKEVWKELRRDRRPPASMMLLVRNVAVPLAHLLAPDCWKPFIKG